MFTTRKQQERDAALAAEALERIRRARLALQRAEENDAAWDRQFRYSFEPAPERPPRP